MGKPPTDEVETRLEPTADARGSGQTDGTRTGATSPTSGACSASRELPPVDWNLKNPLPVSLREVEVLERWMKQMLDAVLS